MTQQGITDNHLTRGKLTNNMNLASSHIKIFLLQNLSTLLLQNTLNYTVMHTQLSRWEQQTFNMNC